MKVITRRNWHWKILQEQETTVQQSILFAKKAIAYNFCEILYRRRVLDKEDFTKKPFEGR